MQNHLVIALSAAFFLSSCASMGGLPGKKSVAYQLELHNNDLIRIDKFPQTFNMKRYGPVANQCSGHPCNADEIEKIPGDKIRNMPEEGEWKEYVQKEYPGQDDVKPDERRKYSTLSRSGNYESGKRTGEWTYYYEAEEGQEPAVLKTVEYRANKRNGAEKKYSSSGEQTEEIHWLEDEKEGPYWRKSKEGLMEVEGTYAAGKMKGVWTSYYVMDEKGKPLSSGGDKKSQSTCNADLKDGHHKEFFRDGGEIKAEGNYNAGKKSGEWKFYHESGHISEVGNYTALPVSAGMKEPEKCWVLPMSVSGGGSQKPLEIRTGIWRQYFDNGQLFAEGTRQKEKTGEWSYYNNKGKLRFKGLMRNDFMMERGESYDNSGVITGKGKFFFSVIQIDKEKDNIKASFRPSKPFTYFHNGKKYLDVVTDEKSKETRGILYDESGRKFGEGPIVAELNPPKKNGCWKTREGAKYYIMDRENPKMGSMMHCK